MIAEIALPLNSMYSGHATQLSVSSVELCTQVMSTSITIDLRQTGHVSFVFSHGNMQAMWTEWPHSVILGCFSSASSWTCSRHTVHTAV